MADIQVEIEGQGAIAATQELFSNSGFSGNYEIDSKPEKEGTVATIAGIVGGTTTAAEQIRKWYKDYKQGKSGKKIEKVLLVSRRGKRLLLENATLEQIKQILDD